MLLEQAGLAAEIPVLWSFHFIFANREAAESSIGCGEQAKLRDAAGLKVSLGALDQARNTLLTNACFRHCQSESEGLFTDEAPEVSEALPPVASPATASGKHMRVPFHCWPHQQKPSALMMQVPLPQQRGSSMIFSNRLIRHKKQSK